MTVKELIKYLQELPPDLPVVQLWDEGGTYHDMQFLPVVKEIVKSTSPLSHGGKEWTDFHRNHKVFAKKTVVVV